MTKKNRNTISNIATIISIVAMFISCEGSLKDVQKINRSSFLPSGEADSINLKYTDSGRIKSVLRSKKMLDYSNIENGFTEFPQGVLVTMFDENNKTTVIQSNYAITYKKTDIIDLQGNVIITSHDGKKLETEQLYFDQKNEWFFTERHFKYSDGTGGFLQGPGVDFSKDFKIFNMQTSNGEINNVDEQQ
ncbi:LPS export ABC transporter periplasmic protein LptC [Flavobacterium sp. J27]|uniref:LPS export ABC transporter periplasmic protein LptC n=1 Tax=Flavobacterium sp. J27 TaxID=2060419 RepID=UPI001F0DEF83|nr:LPS export ABC transporter periplasmic protein LptC [Flavobacterium sp. J27]